MPFKDAELYMREAVESVLGQTWSPLELLLVDDGGTDGSRALAQEFVAADPRRVRVVSHEGRVNRGIGPSRALGITRAQGDIVAFLDADDVWEPDHLADDVRLLLAHPEAAMVCGRTWLWETWADARGKDQLSKLAFAPGAEVRGQQLLAAVLRNGGMATAPSALLVRRGALLGCTDDLSRFPGMYEDQVMNSWLQLRRRAVMSGATSTWYRKHPTSFSLTASGPARGSEVGRTAFLTWLQGQVHEIRELDAGIEDLLARALADARQRDLAALRPPERTAQAREILTRSARRPMNWAQTFLGSRAHPAGETEEVWLDRVLAKHRADLRGDVLLLGEMGSVQPGPETMSLRRLDVPEPRLPPGPHHPLARLPSSAYDCVVVRWPGPAARGADLGLRHLRRALRPAGVLLLAATRGKPRLEDDLRAVFGWDNVKEDDPRDRPFVLLRAAIPTA